MKKVIFILILLSSITMNAQSFSLPNGTYKITKTLVANVNKDKQGTGTFSALPTPMYTSVYKTSTLITLSSEKSKVNIVFSGKETGGGITSYLGSYNGIPARLTLSSADNIKGLLIMTAKKAEYHLIR